MEQRLQKSLKVMLIDDHTLFAEGLAKVLSGHASQPTVSICDTGASALTRLTTGTRAHKSLELDVILVDLELPDIKGADLIKSLRSKGVQIPILIISGSQDEREVQQALDSGANGYLPKSANSNSVIDAIHKVFNGDIYIPDALWSKLDPYARGELKNNKLENQALPISARQKEVLVLLERGYSNARIADLLGISVATVKTHLIALFRALNTNNRTECVRAARKMQLIE